MKAAPPALGEASCDRQGEEKRQPPAWRVEKSFSSSLVMLSPVIAGRPAVEDERFDRVVCLAFFATFDHERTKRGGAD